MRKESCNPDIYIFHKVVSTDSVDLWKKYQDYDSSLLAGHAGQAKKRSVLVQREIPASNKL